MNRRKEPEEVVLPHCCAAAREGWLSTGKKSEMNCGTPGLRLLMAGFARTTFAYV